MIDESTMYWVTRLDSIRGALTASGFLAGFGWSICLMKLICSNGGSRWAMRLIVLFSVLFTASFVAVVFVPSTKEMIAIKAVPAIVNSGAANRVTHEMVEAALRIIESAGKKEKKR